SAARPSFDPREANRRSRQRPHDPYGKATDRRECGARNLRRRQCEVNTLRLITQTSNENISLLRKHFWNPGEDLVSHLYTYFLRWTMRLLQGCSVHRLRRIVFCLLVGACSYLYQAPWLSFE